MSVDEVELKPCKECGRIPSKKKGKPQERHTLAVELCRLMNWQSSDIWKVQNQALGQDKMRQIVYALHRKDSNAKE